jgi:hypothetical protein
MGIYYDTSGTYYGIKFVVAERDFYVRTCDNEMSAEEQTEARQVYLELKSAHETVLIFVYIECTMTYDYPPTTAKVWYGIRDESEIPSFLL